MAKRREREHSEAVKLRMKGWSYSQIKNKLGVGKGTLSGWLEGYPLSPERLKALRDNNPRRIENFRKTMLLKKTERLDSVYNKIKKDIGKLSRRELFLAGLFLYWAEGYKTSIATTAIANADPSMLRFFIKWLKIVNAPLLKLRVKIHVYNDMDKEETISFWMKELKLPRSCFRQVYVKESRLSGLSYKSGFGHGTCNVMLGNRNLNDYVMMALRYIREELSTL